MHSVQVVSSYSHLGGLIHHKHDNTAEIRRRIAIAQATFTQHRKTLLQNAALSLKRRVELFRSLVLSRLLYGNLGSCARGRASAIFTLPYSGSTEDFCRVHMDNT